MLPFVYKGPPREEFKTALIFRGKRDDRIVFMTTVVAYPAPTATWDRIVSDNSVIPINDFTFNVSAHVDILGEKNYGNYNVTIDNNNGDNILTLSFIIRSEGNTCIHITCTCNIYSERIFLLLYHLFKFII